MASNFLTGFLTGFMSDQAQKIGERKAEAKDYFNEQMKLAQRKVFEYQTTQDPRMSAALQTAKQLQAVGVPQSTVMAIINQNPDDLPTFLETVQKMKMDGVDMSNPDVYDSLIQIDGEFNPGNENVTSLIQRIYQPLTANAKADPEGFNFDPKGSMWATMLGYNAMERAHDRLAKSEVMPGISAASVLAMGNPEDRPLPQPLGGASVTLNAGTAGDMIRETKDRLRGGDVLTITERRALLDSFNDIVGQELTMMSAPGGSEMSPEERNAEARRRAALKVVRDFPEATTMSEINRWLPQEEPEEEASPLSMPSESPSTAPTAPSAPQATQAPADQGTPPQTLPDGSTLHKDLGDGTVVYMQNGKPVRYSKSYVMQINQGASIMATPPPTPKPGPTMQAVPTSGWLDRLGSEYD